MSEAKFKTLRHIETVRNFMQACVIELIGRQMMHDQTKLQSPEVEIFEKYTARLRGITYGSEEYRQCLLGMKPAIDHHNAHNSHHPEHYKMWRCDVCKALLPDGDKVVGPDPHSGTFYCPHCCKGGIIYECTISPESGIYGMCLFDLIEMLCDWKAAGLRHDDGNIYKSLEINRKRFNISDELYQILLNTVYQIEQWKVPHHAHES